MLCRVYCQVLHVPDYFIAQQENGTLALVQSIVIRLHICPVAYWRRGSHIHLQACQRSNAFAFQLLKTFLWGIKLAWMQMLNGHVNPCFLNQQSFGVYCWMPPTLDSSHVEDPYGIHQKKVILLVFFADWQPNPTPPLGHGKRRLWSLSFWVSHETEITWNLSISCFLGAFLKVWFSAQLCSCALKLQVRWDNNSQAK